MVKYSELHWKRTLKSIPEMSGITGSGVSGIIKREFCATEEFIFTVEELLGGISEVFLRIFEVKIKISTRKDGFLIMTSL